MPVKKKQYNHVFSNLQIHSEEDALEKGKDEQSHKKNNNLHMRKQRCKLAAQQLQSLLYITVYPLSKSEISDS